MIEKTVTLGSTEHAVSLTRDGDAWIVRGPDGAELRVEILALRDGEAEVRLAGRRVVVPFLAGAEGVEFALEGEIRRAAVTAKGRKRGRHSDHSLGAPMPGQVLKIFVETGDRVAKGDPLIVLEAMKMEHQIVAPHDGRVESIACAAGDLVQPGVDLIVVAPEEAS